jgi:hypothetical protein
MRGLFTFSDLVTVRRLINIKIRVKINKTPVTVDNNQFCKISLNTLFSSLFR